MDRSFSALRGVGGLVFALMCGCWSAANLSIETAHAGQADATTRPAVESPLRNVPYPEPLVGELKALGCVGSQWDGESRVNAGKELTDQGLARIVELVADLPNLSLSMNQSGVTDEGLQNLRTLDNLRSLWISEGAVTDAGLAHVAALDQLERLSILDNDQITDAGLLHLGKMDRLKVLALSRTGVTNKGLAYLAELDHLERLSILDNDQITDAGLLHLGKMDRLKVLALARTGVTNRGLPYLKGMKGLEKLSVEPLLVDVGQAPELRDALMAANSRFSGAVQVFDVATGRVRFICEASTSSWLCPLSLSTDGKVAALVDSSQVRLFDTKTGSLLREGSLYNLDGDEQMFFAERVAFSPDCGRIAIAESSRDVATDEWVYTVHVLDTRTMASIRRWPGRLVDVWDMEFSSDGKRLLLHNAPVFLWDVTTGKVGAEVQYSDDLTSIFDAAHQKMRFSPDETQVALATWREVQLWDIATETCKVRWDRHGSNTKVLGCYFDGAGRLLGLAAPDRYSWSSAGYVHDAVTGRLVRKVAFPCPLGDLVLAPNGRRVAYRVGERPKGPSMVGGLVYVCDVTAGKLLTVVEVPQGHRLENGLAFTQDGERLIMFSTPVGDQALDADSHRSRPPTPLPEGREPSVGSRLAALGCFAGKSGSEMRATVTWEDFSDAHLAEVVPLLADFPDLTLALDGLPRLTDEGFESLQHWKNIATLELSRLNIGDAGLEYVGRMPSLKRLSLVDLPQVGDEGLAHLAKLPRLARIEIQGNRRITDVGLGHLAESSSLESIDLRSMDITDRGIAELRRLPELQYLSLSQTRVSFERPPESSRLVGGISFLNITDCPVGDQGIVNLLAMPGLKGVEIRPFLFSPDVLRQFEASPRQRFQQGTAGVRLWDPESGEILRIGTARPTIFTPRGSIRPLASTAGFEVFDLDTGILHRGYQIQRVQRRDNFFSSGALSPDGRLIAGPMWQDSNIVRLFDVDSGNELAQLTGHRSPVHSLVFSPDGRRLLTVGRGARLWDVATHSLVWQVEVRSDDWVRAARFSPDGREIVLQYGCGVERWDVATRKRLASWEPSGEDRFVEDFCFRDDGRVLVLEEDFGGENLAARVIDMADNRPLCKVTAPGKPGQVVEFLLSPDGKWLAANTGDTIQLWDASTGQPHRALPGNEKRPFNGARFVPDGRLLTEE